VAKLLVKEKDDYVSKREILCDRVPAYRQFALNACRVISSTHIKGADHPGLS
jgi:hypothetical protein